MFRHKLKARKPATPRHVAKETAHFQWGTLDTFRNMYVLTGVSKEDAERFAEMRNADQFAIWDK